MPNRKRETVTRAKAQEVREIAASNPGTPQSAASLPWMTTSSAMPPRKAGRLQAAISRTIRNVRPKPAKKADSLDRL